MLFGRFPTSSDCTERHAVLLRLFSGLTRLCRKLIMYSERRNDGTKYGDRRDVHWFLILLS
jgi:hypothetical protein